MAGLVNLFISHRRRWGDRAPAVAGDLALMRGGDCAARTAGSVRCFFAARGGGDGRWLAGYDRGKVGTFSAASRRRFRESVELLDADLRRNLYAWSFLTLTYPRHFVSAADSKRHLDVFNKRFCRAWPGAVALWCLEAQRRGAPHYHLLVRWADSDLAANRRNWSSLRALWARRRAWVSANWAVVVGEGTACPVHVVAGTRLEPVRHVRRLREYMAKRRSKSLDTARLKNELVKRAQRQPGVWDDQGKWWGVHNRAGFWRMARFAWAVLPPGSAEVALPFFREVWGERVGDQMLMPPRWVDGEQVRGLLGELGLAWSDFLLGGSLPQDESI